MFQAGGAEKELNQATMPVISYMLPNLEKASFAANNRPSIGTKAKTIDTMDPIQDTFLSDVLGSSVTLTAKPRSLYERVFLPKQRLFDRAGETCWMSFSLIDDDNKALLRKAKENGDSAAIKYFKSQAATITTDGINVMCKLGGQSFNADFAKKIALVKASCHHHKTRDGRDVIKFSSHHTMAKSPNDYNKFRDMQIIAMLDQARKMGAVAEIYMTQSSPKYRHEHRDMPISRMPMSHLDKLDPTAIHEMSQSGIDVQAAITYARNMHNSKPATAAPNAVLTAASTANPSISAIPQTQTGAALQPASQGRAGTQVARSGTQGMRI